MDKVKHLLESPQLRPFLDTKTTFDTGHKDAVNDAKLDYYSRKLATASSDKTVRIYSIDHCSGAFHRVAELTGYEGPVWQVCWSHPKIGSLLASASYDGRVIVWKEAHEADCPLNCKWLAVFDEQLNKVSVNSISWASPEQGILLVAGSSDGSISILSTTGENEGWSIKRIFRAHELGCQTVSWSNNSRRFASGGNDTNVKIWSVLPESLDWTLEATLLGHSDWVFCVEWSPSEDCIASAGRDGRILLWSKVEEPEKPKWNHSSSFNASNSSFSHSLSSIASQTLEDWYSQVLQVFDKSSTFHVSWEPMGIFLCVARNEDELFIWKKGPDYKWMCISKPNVVKDAKVRKNVSFVDVRLD